MADEEKKAFSLYDAPPEPKVEPKPRPQAQPQAKPAAEHKVKPSAEHKRLAEQTRAAAKPAPAKRRTPPAEGERRPTIAPSDVCTRCALPKPTARRFVVVHHSPEEEESIWIKHETIVYHQVDYYCLALCADCRKHSDLLYKASRVLGILRIVASAAFVLAIAMLYLEFDTFLKHGVLLFVVGGGLAAFSIAAKWFVNYRHVNYLPLDFNYGRKVVFHATDVHAFTGYLQDKHGVPSDALREIRETFR